MNDRLLKIKETYQYAQLPGDIPWLVVEVERLRAIEAAAREHREAETALSYMEPSEGQKWRFAALRVCHLQEKLDAALAKSPTP